MKERGELMQNFMLSKYRELLESDEFSYSKEEIEIRVRSIELRIKEGHALNGGSPEAALTQPNS